MSSKALHPDDAALLAVEAGEAPASVRAHVQSCAHCQQSRRALAQVVALGRQQEAVSMAQSARVKRQLLAQMQSEAGAQRAAWRPSKVAAALAFAAFSGAAAAMTAAGVAPWSPSPTVSRSAAGPIGPQAAGSNGAAAVRLVPAPTSSAPTSSAPTSSAPTSPTPPAHASSPVALASPARHQKQQAASIQQTPPSSFPSPAHDSASDSASDSVSDSVNKTRPPIVRVASSLGAPKEAKTDVARSPSPTAHRIFRAQGSPTAAQAAKTAWRQAELAPVGDAIWLDVGDLFAQAGQADRSAEAYVRALCCSSSKPAAQRLRQVAGGDASRVLHILRLIEKHSGAKASAEGMRLRCEWGLRYRGDRPSVQACLAFGRAYPAHPALRLLALAAGQTAETRLEDCALAIRAYSRALLLTEYAGLASTEALFRRARCRAKQGALEEAGADLRLYLHLNPEAREKSEVSSLARSLGWP